MNKSRKSYEIENRKYKTKSDKSYHLSIEMNWNLCNRYEILHTRNVIRFYEDVLYIRKKERENKKRFAHDRVNKPKARKVDKARNVRGTLAVIVTRQSRCRAVR